MLIDREVVQEKVGRCTEIGVTDGQGKVSRDMEIQADREKVAVTWR